MDRIRQLRKERGLSQAKLAVMADMDPATLNRLEQGKGNPNLKTLERVASALGVEVADLLPKAESRSSLEPSLLNGLEEKRRSPLAPWAEFGRRMARHIRAHTDDPHSPAFRTASVGFFFVEEMNRLAAELYFLIFEEDLGQEAYAEEPISAVNEVLVALEELVVALEGARARAELVEAGRGVEDLERVRRRAEEAAAKRKHAATRVSARLESRGA